ncbi:unnamed protein product, partial [Pylaiella littoralis]
GRHRRRAKHDSRGDGYSRGSAMDTLTTTSVSTVTRGVALHWKPRLNTDLGSFVYPSIMLERPDEGLQPEGSLQDLSGSGGSRKGSARSRSGNRLQK